jgi:hypothetical protein
LKLRLGREADGFISQISKHFNFCELALVSRFRFFNASKPQRIADKNPILFSYNRP